MVLAPLQHTQDNNVPYPGITLTIINEPVWIVFQDRKILIIDNAKTLYTIPLWWTSRVWSILWQGKENREFQLGANLQDAKRMNAQEIYEGYARKQHAILKKLTWWSRPEKLIPISGSFGQPHKVVPSHCPRMFVKKSTYPTSLKGRICKLSVWVQGDDLSTAQEHRNNSVGPLFAQMPKVVWQRGPVQMLQTSWAFTAKYIAEKRPPSSLSSHLSVTWSSGYGR